VIYKKALSLIFILGLLSSWTLAQSKPSYNQDALVKKSKKGICLTSNQRGYKKIKHSKTYSTLDECIRSGVKMPKR
jgi:hypothetical protein